MLHYLTVGFLDADAVRQRRVRPTKPLSQAILDLLLEFLDEDFDDRRMEGAAVEVTQDWVRCPWYAPHRNRTTEKFAIEAGKRGCLVADVEHGRLVDCDSELSR